MLSHVYAGPSTVPLTVRHSNCRVADMVAEWTLLSGCNIAGRPGCS